VEVNTDKVDSESGSQVKRTVTGTAVGTGTGAAIGGALGGGAGAGIGAGVGAAGGAVAGKLFGKAVEIAPETRFTYTLTQSLVVDYQGPAAAPQARLQRPPTPAPAREPEPQPQPVAVVVPPPVPRPPDRPVSIPSEPDFIGAVYFQDESGTLLSLEQNRGIERKTYWEMAGARSQVRFKSGQKMTFVVRLATGIDPKSFKLYPLETKNENRRTTPMTLTFNVIKVGESSYGLIPVQDLAAGEYAFSPKNSDEAYCFGIDP
jgi:hypothetical protein